MSRPTIVQRHWLGGLAEELAASIWLHYTPPKVLKAGREAATRHFFDVREACLEANAWTVAPQHDRVMVRLFWESTNHGGLFLLFEGTGPRLTSNWRIDVRCIVSNETTGLAGSGTRAVAMAHTCDVPRRIVLDVGKVISDTTVHTKMFGNV